MPRRAICRSPVGTLEQQGGELASRGTLTLDADSLDNRNGGLVSADGGVTAEARQDR
ncbi:hypothetical protein ACPA9J_27745 [Pseudomonas aeruginosa]